VPSDEVPRFERCGNTDFWRPEGQTNDDLQVTFVDPVSMVVVTSNPQQHDRLLVLRGWFEDFYSELFSKLHTALPENESVPLNLWIRTIMEALPGTGKAKIIRKFAEMHPEAQRTLISGILHWLTKVPEGWKADNRMIPAKLNPLWQLLNSAGIHEC
jgi:hypothetical protein